MFTTQASLILRYGLALVSLTVFPSFSDAQNQREKKVRDDKINVEADGFWIYNDLPKAFEEATWSKKPLVVVFRCIPCEECVKLDDELLKEDPELHALLEKFVRVRVVSTNGLDLSLFQFDYDQSFAVFFLNADSTIYGRYGTRSHRTEWADDVSVSGLKMALLGALKLHADFPANKDSLAAKRGPKPPYPVPEKFPSLMKYSSTLDYEDKVVQSCIHCHMIGDAINEQQRNSAEGMSVNALFPFPHPKSLGLILDPKKYATVSRVIPDSPAAKSGFQTGDVIESLEGQPLLSIADVQWVLHQAGADETSLKAKVVRDNKSLDIDFLLPKGWRERGDISWRASTWELRRLALGGLQLQDADPRPSEIPAGSMALDVKHVGQYSPHDEAKKAGFLPGDLIISFGGRTDLLRETDILAYAMRSQGAGDSIRVDVLREGKKIEFALPRKD